MEELGKLGACPWTLQKEKSYWKAKVSGPSEWNFYRTGWSAFYRLEVELYIPAQFIDSCVFLD